MRGFLSDPLNQETCLSRYLVIRGSNFSPLSIARDKNHYPSTPLQGKIRFRIGCSGWSYKDWVGSFYPKDLSPSDYLVFYSRVFDCVEIDSSFYRIPLPGMVDSWKKSTPENFLFSPKLTKKITHENKLENYLAPLERFYEVMARFGEKIGPILVQLPPSIKAKTHRSLLEDFLSELDVRRFRHAIEFRHRSWFETGTYKLLEKYGVALCWSQNQYLSTPNEVTSSFVYLRMVGERDITDFSKIQKDRHEEMKAWLGKLSEKGSLYDEAFIFFNNHFAGFGPASVNEFRRLSGLMEMDWSQEQEMFSKSNDQKLEQAMKGREQAEGPSQTSLTDF